MAEERSGSGLDTAERRVPESWRQLLDAVPAAVVIVAPDGSICFTNQEFDRLTRYRSGRLAGQQVDVLLPESRRAAHRAARDGFNAVPRRRPMGSGLAIECRRADGTAFPADISLSPLEIGGETFVVATVADETEHRRSSEELFHRAVHDPLTGLANRVLLADRLTQALARRAARPARKVAVLYVDLDGFKAVNDTWRHAVGDEVLRTVADRFANVVRPEDTVARFGGDEFVILCEELASEDAALAVAERILEAVSEPILHRAGTCLLGASVGVVLADGQSDADTLVERADRAMYKAKSRGGRTIEMIPAEHPEA